MWPWCQHAHSPDGPRRHQEDGPSSGPPGRGRRCAEHLAQPGKRRRLGPLSPHRTAESFQKRRGDRLWHSRSSATTACPMWTLARRAAVLRQALCEHEPLAGALPAHSLLAGRYTIGRCLGLDGEGITYSAIDGKEMRPRHPSKSMCPSLFVRRARQTARVLPAAPGARCCSKPPAWILQTFTAALCAWAAPRAL